ncbi:MAG: archaeosortase/exosortase family protein [Nibricoccus sp.]
MIAEPRKGGSAEQTEAGRVMYEGKGVPRWVLCVGVLVMNWQVVRWYVARLGDGGDEPWGLMALVAALVFSPRTVWRARLTNTAVITVALLAAAALLSGQVLPMLVRAGIVVTALAVVIGGPAPSRSVWGGELGRLGLLVLSLPVMATAQFYAGYPLRVLTAELGRPLLWLAGVATERSGVLLSWTGGEVAVDAPCSGIRMLWVGAALACGLAAWRRSGVGKTAGLLALGVGGVVAGNAVRAAVLFLTESGVWLDAPWVHETVGAVIFGAVAMGLWVWAGKGKCEEGRVKGETQRTERLRVSGWRWMGWVSAGLAVLVSGGMLGSRARGNAADATAESALEADGNWPEFFEGAPLMPVGKRERLGDMVGGLAGETRVFTQNGRVVLLRRLRASSRTVHPVADCFRARGYRVAAQRLVKDEGGALWSEFEAERGADFWRVRERWRDERGRQWTDVSAWWWAAQAADAHGPWWAEAVAVRG